MKTRADVRATVGLSPEGKNKNSATPGPLMCRCSPPDPTTTILDRHLCLTTSIMRVSVSIAACIDLEDSSAARSNLVARQSVVQTELRRGGPEAGQRFFASLLDLCFSCVNPLVRRGQSKALV